MFNRWTAACSSQVTYQANDNPQAEAGQIVAVAVGPPGPVPGQAPVVGHIPNTNSRRYPIKELFFPDPVLGLLVVLFRLASCIYAASTLDDAYKYGYPVDSYAPIYATNGMDITWTWSANADALKSRGSWNQGWLSYEQLYARILHSGYIPLIIHLLFDRILMVSNPDNERQLSSLLATLPTIMLGLLVLFGLPAIFTHLYPALVAYVWVLGLPVIGALTLAKYCLEGSMINADDDDDERTTSFWKRVAGFGLWVSSSSAVAACVTIAAQMAFTYASLLYSVPAPVRPAAYLDIIPTEAHLRNDACYWSSLSAEHAHSGRNWVMFFNNLF